MTREEARRILEVMRVFALSADEDRLDLTSDEIIDALAVAIEALKQPERKHGKWIDTGSGQECNVCHEIQYGYDNFRHFCSNCGAKMQE